MKLKSSDGNYNQGDILFSRSKKFGLKLDKIEEQDDFKCKINVLDLVKTQITVR